MFEEQGFSNKSDQYKFLSPICDALRNLVPFVQFEKCEKHSWRTDNFSKLQSLAFNFTKIITPPWVFFTFFKL